MGLKIAEEATGTFVEMIRKSSGIIGVLVMEGVSVIVAVGVMVKVSVMVGVRVGVGVSVIVGVGMMTLYNAVSPKRYSSAAAPASRIPIKINFQPLETRACRLWKKVMRCPF